MRLSIVIPVRNECETVLPLIERVRAVDCGMPKELIIVDGASTDGTREALQSLLPADDVVLVLEERARGKGRAVRTGFERAGGDIVMVQDADLELDPAEIPLLLAPIVSGRTDVVFGSRFKGRGRGRTPLVGYAGNMLLTWAANILYLARLTDILTCYKVLHADVARTLDLRCNGFDLDAEITCRLLRDGHRIQEVPVRYEPRGVDEGKKLSAGVGWSVLRAIIRVRFDRRRPQAPPQRPLPADPRERVAMMRGDDRDGER
ncbi:MAG: glycosyltransferase family 2 protein [Chloroflexi bacterium]|nr:glycosyltransferase family 2 protein [Chloroflexota bacterium]